MIDTAELRAKARGWANDRDSARSLYEAGLAVLALLDTIEERERDNAALKADNERLTENERRLACKILAARDRSHDLAASLEAEKDEADLFLARAEAAESANAELRERVEEAESDAKIAHQHVAAVCRATEGKDVPPEFMSFPSVRRIAGLRAVIARIANDGCGLAHRTEAGGKWLTCDESALSDDDRCWSCIARRALTPASAEGDRHCGKCDESGADVCSGGACDDCAEPTSEGDEHRAETAEAHCAELRAVIAGVREWATLTVYTKAADEVFAILSSATPDSAEGDDNG